MSLTPKTEVYWSGEREAGLLERSAPKAAAEHALGKKTAFAARRHKDPNIRLTTCFLQGMVSDVVVYIDRRPTKTSPRNEMLNAKNRVGLMKTVLGIQKMRLN